MFDTNIIVAGNPHPSPEEFQDLMRKIELSLNEEAKLQPEYFLKRNGVLLEDDVVEVARECAINTPFENQITKVSGQQFPDIVASKYYGIEVKSTKENHWTSIGSSILETTRISDIERIFLLFGKLAHPVAFKSRRYEECLSDIVVTHYPRYQINMTLESGNTIFDKMEVSYESLRKMDNPVIPVARYYKKHLGPGESLWWTGDDPEEESVPAVARLWNTLTPEEKNDLMVKAYVLFPESIFEKSSVKYSRVAIWLATKMGIICPCIRDSFSAGGQKMMKREDGKMVPVPAVLKRIDNDLEVLYKYMNETSPGTLSSYWDVFSDEKDRASQWASLILEKAAESSERNAYRSVLKRIFKEKLGVDLDI